MQINSISVQKNICKRPPAFGGNINLLKLNGVNDDFVDKLHYSNEYYSLLNAVKQGCNAECNMVSGCGKTTMGQKLESDLAKAGIKSLRMPFKSYFQSIVSPLDSKEIFRKFLLQVESDMPQVIILDDLFYHNNILDVFNKNKLRMMLDFFKRNADKLQIVILDFNFRPEKPTNHPTVQNKLKDEIFSIVSSKPVNLIQVYKPEKEFVAEAMEKIFLNAGFVVDRPLIEHVIDSWSSLPDRFAKIRDVVNSIINTAHFLNKSDYSDGLTELTLKEYKIERGY